MTIKVGQSFRRDDVPSWLQRCMAGVEKWARASGYEYEFIDDALFDLIPPAWREAIGPSKVVLSDFARLLWAERELAAGVERFIWIDADVLILAPDEFAVPLDSGYGFCREVWLARGPDGALLASERINNAVCTFARQNTLLPFYLEACQQRIRWAGSPVPKLALGTAFLTPLHRLAGLSLIPHVGLISPLLGDAVLRGNGQVLDQYVERFGQTHHAVNLCASLQSTTLDGVVVSEDYFERISERLLQGGGWVLNQRLGQV